VSKDKRNVSLLEADARDRVRVIAIGKVRSPEPEFYVCTTKL
jgi:hypothetical protein